VCENKVAARVVNFLSLYWWWLHSNRISDISYLILFEQRQRPGRMQPGPAHQRFRPRIALWWSPSILRRRPTTCLLPTRSSSAPTWLARAWRSPSLTSARLRLLLSADARWLVSGMDWCSRNRRRSGGYGAGDKGRVDKEPSAHGASKRDSWLMRAVDFFFFKGTVAFFRERMDCGPSVPHACVSYNIYMLCSFFFIFYTSIGSIWSLLTIMFLIISIH
jgi:hypothetical protein